MSAYSGHLSRPCALAALLGLTAASTAQSAGPLDLSWCTIDGGGGIASNGGFALAGTIGQPDAGIMDDGAGLVMLSGFWALDLGAPQPCYSDCDTSTGIRTLDIFDFLCFQNRFASADPYACDCDTSTGAATCDIFDFLCFQNAYAGGCP
jgi:hypothetical protein